MSKVGTYWMHNTFPLIAEVTQVHGQQPLVHLEFPFGTVSKEMDSKGWIPTRTLYHFYTPMAEEDVALYLLAEVGE